MYHLFFSANQLDGANRQRIQYNVKPAVNYGIFSRYFQLHEHAVASYLIADNAKAIFS